MLCFCDNIDGFDYIDGSIIDDFHRVYDAITYLVIFGTEKYDSIYNRIIYVTGAKGPITYISSHNYAE